MRIDIAEALDPDTKGTSLWVLNKSKGDSRGSVIFNVNDAASGRIIDVKIPDTFLPFNVLKRVTRTQLADSQDFRRAEATGLIELIDDESARRLLSRPGAKRELARLKRHDEQISAYQSAFYAGAKAPVQTRIDDDGSEEEPQLHQRVMGIEAYIRDNTQVGAINRLRAISEELSRADLRHVHAVAVDGGHRKLEIWTRNLIRRTDGSRRSRSKSRKRAAATA